MSSKLLMALDCFLFTPTNEVAEKNEVSVVTVGNARRQYEAQRNDILKFYYQNGESREAVEQQFSPAPVQTNESDRLQEIEKRLTTVESNLKCFADDLDSMLGLVSAPTEQTIEVKAPPNPNGLNIPMPKSLEADPIDRRAFRLHITGQAVDQWIKLFGTDAHGPEADIMTIRKRIAGVYFNGEITGKGMRWTVKGIHNYSLDGIEMKCVLQRDTMVISEIKTIPLDEM